MGKENLFQFKKYLLLRFEDAMSEPSLQMQVHGKNILKLSFIIQSDRL